MAAPTEKVNIALDRDAEEAEVVLSAGDAKAPLVALAFKLEESRFGQLTYMRIYQGMLRKGDFFYNVDKRERQKVPRLVRMHAPHRTRTLRPPRKHLPLPLTPRLRLGRTRTPAPMRFRLVHPGCGSGVPLARCGLEFAAWLLDSAEHPMVVHRPSKAE